MGFEMLAVVSVREYSRESVVLVVLTVSGSGTIYRVSGADWSVPETAMILTGVLRAVSATTYPVTLSTLAPASGVRNLTAIDERAFPSMLNTEPCSGRATPSESRSESFATIEGKGSVSMAIAAANFGSVLISAHAPAPSTVAESSSAINAGIPRLRDIALRTSSAIHSLDERSCDVDVRLRCGVRRAARHYRLTGGERIRRCNRARHELAEDDIRGQVLPNVLDDALAGRIVGLVHRQNEPVQYQLLVELDDALNSAKDLRRGLQRKRLALQRHHDVLAAEQYLVRDGAEPGGCVDDYYVTALARRFQQLGKQFRVGDQALICEVIGFVTDRASENHTQPRQHRWKNHVAQRALAAQIVGEAVSR